MKRFDRHSEKLLFILPSLVIFLSLTLTAGAMTQQTKQLFQKLGKAWAGSFCKGKTGQDKNDCCGQRAENCSNRCDEIWKEGNAESGLDDCKQGCGFIAGNSCMASTAPAQSSSIQGILDMEQTRIVKWTIIDAEVHKPSNVEDQKQEYKPEKK